MTVLHPLVAPRRRFTAALRTRQRCFAPRALAVVGLLICACGDDGGISSLDGGNDASDGSSEATGGSQVAEGDPAHPNPDSPDAGPAVTPDSGVPDGSAPPSSPPRVIGLSFVPLETQNQEAQTVAHMELTGVLFLPGDRGLLIWEKIGRITHYVLGEGERLIQQGEFTLDDIFTSSDCGLVSVALDPDWEDTGYFYAGHCVTKFDSEVTRYEFHGDDYDQVAATASPVISFGDPHASKPWHNVGAIGFFDDPEHSMWILAGEKTVDENGQDLTNNLGSVLRIIPRRAPGSSGYDPHPDNPFGGPGADPGNSSSPDLYAWGLRSPWRGTVDDRNRIWIGDVGSKIEEVDLATGPGLNFGWPLSDGPCAGDAQCDTLRDPATYWNRGSGHRYRKEDPEAAATSKRCVWVGAQYRPGGPDVYEGFLDGAVLAGDMCVGWVRAFAADETGTIVRDDAAGHLVGVSGMAQGPDGYLYATSYGSCSSSTHGFGGVYRIVPRYDVEPDPPDPPQPRAPLVDDPLGALPLKLSATGIFADAELTQPIARAIRYEPSLPLWSSGSDKERWLVLPEGTQVDNSRRDAWEFPPGTLFFKTFAYTDPAGVTKRIETRLIRRAASGWEYHAYMWNGGDADLLTLEQPIYSMATAEDGVAFWHEIPSRFDCKSCHESNDTSIIGFDELRLNAPRTGGTEPQLVELERAGVFAQPIPAQPDTITEPDAQTAAVLGYLHGNCAHCHNRSARTMSALSLEHDVALASIVGVPTQGSGQAAGIRVVPGSPEQSVLFQAFSGETDDPEVLPMPPISVARRDAAAVELLRAWITALPAP